MENETNATEATELVTQASEKVNYEELLKTDKGLQSLFDRKVTQATATAVENDRKKQELFQSQQLSEAEKLAKMNETEKQEFRLKKQDEVIEDLQRTINTNNLKNQTLALISEENIPVSFLEFFDFSKETADTITNKLTNLKGMFDKEVENKLNLSLNEKPIKTVNNTNTKTITKEQFQGMNTMERTELYLNDNVTYSKLVN